MIKRIILLTIVIIFLFIRCVPIIKIPESDTMADLQSISNHSIIFLSKAENDKGELYLTDIYFTNII